MRETNACIAVGIKLTVGNSYQLTSPFYPFAYPSHSFCYWTARSPSDTKIHMTCDFFHVDPRHHCAYSALYISKTGDPFLRDANTYCGHGTVQITTSSNYFSAFFRSSQNNFDFYQGFHCRLTAATDITNPGPSTTPSPTTNEECSCGMKGSSRIVNGDESEINEWKWQVSLLTKDLEHFCGGAIIANSWILTAAHCMVYPADSMYVVVGEHNNENDSESSHTRVIGVEQIIIHEDYNKRTIDNDIALLKLEDPIDCSEGVGPICLPEEFTTEDYKDTTAWYTGWGTTAYGGDSSNMLQEVEIPVKTTEECKKIFDVNNMGNRITENMICTYKPGYDACQGDSGGALSWEKDGRFYVIGIVSWGINCAQEGYPGVSTNVVQYKKWISESITD